MAYLRCEPKNPGARQKAAKPKTYGPLLLHRFGPEILSNHYKIVPEALEDYSEPLCIRPCEVRFLVFLWNRWKLYEERIQIAVADIAEGLHVSESRVQRYTQSLKEKGLLEVTRRPGRGQYNSYDLRPLREKLRALVRGFSVTVKTEAATRQWKQAHYAQPTLGHVKDELWAALDSISRQFRDRAPKSSLTRAARLWFKLGLPLEDYKDWIQEARRRTKDHWAGIAATPMQYFFGILEKGPHPRTEPVSPAAPAEQAEQEPTNFPYWDETPLPASESQRATTETPAARPPDEEPEPRPGEWEEERAAAIWQAETLVLLQHDASAAPLDRHARQVWQSTLERLQSKISPAAFRWFGSTSAVSLQGHFLIVQTPNTFSRTHLEKRYSDLVGSILYDLVGPAAEVQFVIGEADTPISRAPLSDEVSHPGAEETLDRALPLKRQPRWWEEAVMLGFPRIEYLTDTDSWRAIQGEEAWQQFKISSSRNEQERVQIALRQAKRVQQQRRASYQARHQEGGNA
jgi:DNA-binding MarR family transcriptional regulator